MVYGPNHEATLGEIGTVDTPSVLGYTDLEPIKRPGVDAVFVIVRVLGGVGLTQDFERLGSCPRFHEARDRECGNDAEYHNHDHELDERKATAVTNTLSHVVTPLYIMVYGKMRRCGSPQVRSDFSI